MMRKNPHEIILRTVTSGVLGALFFLLYFYTLPIGMSCILCIIFLLIYCYEWQTLIKAFSPHVQILFSVGYLIFPFYALIVLNQATEYRLLFLLIFLLVPTFDTGSYIAGSSIGYHKICPRISPQKTWEGTIGGFVLTLIIFYLAGYFLQFHVCIATCTILTCIISILALCGDLFESWLKRCAGVKDASTLLPGHGGLLDRFDSILPVAAFFYIFRNVIITLFH